ncbi:hypothetical protein TRVA0_029S01662 [Trichomonascus vanleenenianus]|uniref:uncharacterized protein n=1 Tax=Trichomonascus vanleenenianus TaxID=2268995 RepID=UPI003ECABD2C
MKSPREEEQKESQVPSRRVRRRPPKLELDDGKGSGEGSSTSSSLRTPLEIANDIAIQCVSPGISTFLDAQTRDAVIMSRTIEAEQRKLIAQRAGEQTPIGKSEGPQNQQRPGSAGEVRSAGSLKGSSKRQPPPAMLNLGSPSFQRADRSLSINSAPLLARFGAGWPQKGQQQPPPRSISNPIANYQRTTMITTDDSTGGNEGRPTTTTIYVRRKPDSTRGAQSSVPSFPGPRRATTAQPVSAVEEAAEGDDEEEDDDRDPEDAALSDAEKGDDDDPEAKAIDAEDEVKTRLKRRRVEKDQDEKEEAGDGGNDPKTASSDRAIAKKRRFLELCSELWDLMNE